MALTLRREVPNGTFRRFPFVVEHDQNIRIAARTRRKFPQPRPLLGEAAPGLWRVLSGRAALK